MLIKAFVIAARAHKGQKDKGGKAYILHPLKVARSVKGVRCKTVALLHDTVEDAPVTLEALEMCGFDSEVIKAIDAITRRENEPYNDYLKRVKANSIARAVKLADIRHNSDLSRLKTVTDKDVSRYRRYCAAAEYLLTI